jgi:predicted  nucleic acid-binding Zn-ribbon protein
MSIDLELLTVARNYAVKVETEFKKAQAEWRSRFTNLDDELQALYRERDELKKKLKLKCSSSSSM